MNPQEFQKLDGKEKKEFLSNDMAERIIRVEQRVSAKFGRLTHYNRTEYYKSLSPVQQKSFEKYLKNRGKKKVLISLIVLIPIIALSLLNIHFTGNVVNENLGSYQILDYALIVFLIFSLLIFAIYLKNKKSRDKKINGHIGIIDNLLMRKSYLK